MTARARWVAGEARRRGREEREIPACLVGDAARHFHIALPRMVSIRAMVTDHADLSYLSSGDGARAMEDTVLQYQDKEERRVAPDARSGQV